MELLLWEKTISSCLDRLCPDFSVILQWIGNYDVQSFLCILQGPVLVEGGIGNDGIDVLE